MGGSAWSDDHYRNRGAARAKLAADTGRKTVDVAFAYDADVRAGRAKGVHKSMDPNGVVFRESRDSDAHPEAIPIVVLCDVTGSMRTVPHTVQAKLGKLMQLLIRKGYVEHPAILVGAIGDATCDNVPLQVGQFESGIEIEDCLTNLYLEGGGGSHITESYELAMYFVARHTVHDHLEKRGRKGYLFMVGDESPYGNIKRAEVEKVIGTKLDQDISVTDIVTELQKKYEVFFILPDMTSHFHDRTVRSRWNELLGQNVLFLDDPSAICELIASQVGIFEGVIDTVADAEHDLIDAGTADAAAKAVGRALIPTGATGGKGQGLAQKLPTSGAPSGVANFGS